MHSQALRRMQRHHDIVDADYSLDFLPNQRRFFGFGSSAGTGPSVGFSSFSAGFFSFAAGSSSIASARSNSGRFGFGSAFFRFAFFSSSAFASMSSAISTHSMNAIGAESLMRCPSFTIRVYPPLRSADLGAMSSNNFLTTFFWRKVAKALRRA